jgi:predicted transcriptional regulator
LGGDKTAEERQMKTVTIGVASLDAVKDRVANAFRGKKQGAFISFVSEDLLLSTLTSKRMALLRAMAGQGEMSIREAARRSNRDVHAVHRDVKALLDAGVLQQENGNIVFPYDAIHVDFMVQAAA